jgi:hypothetical protein
MRICDQLRSVSATCVFVIFLAAQAANAAETGSIKGRVLDKTTGEPLPGANVLVQNTNIGAAADLDGKFIIHTVPTGKQSLRISYIGYETILRDVDVAVDQEANVEIKLGSVSVTGEEVVVTAQVRGQNAAINQKLASNQIIDVVSAEKMKELPDANIAESIGRLPGISLQRNAGEATGVVVRGMSPKYNEVTIEGGTDEFDKLLRSWHRPEYFE